MILSIRGGNKMSFIEELFYGNINPNEKRFAQDSEYARALRRFCDNEKKLSEQLSGDNMKLFNDLINAHDEVTAYTSVENFKIGIILGVQLMTDCFKYDADMIFKDS